jgi:hypothetical protein
MNAREGVRTNYLAPPMKVIRIEAFLVERPLTDRFWMSIFPIDLQNQPFGNRLHTPGSELISPGSG